VASVNTSETLRKTAARAVGRRPGGIMIMAVFFFLVIVG
jgi:hypothetical protein